MPTRRKDVDAKRPMNTYQPPTRAFCACGICAALCLIPEREGQPLRTPLFGRLHTCASPHEGVHDARLLHL